MNVGDYVRTKYGIAKIIDISCGEDLYFDNDNIFDEDEKEIFRYNKPSMYSNWADNNIIKSSPNIIDLIEVGDYVNGEKVIRLFNPTFLSMGELPYVITDKSKYEPQEIENVVTKEQFENCMYRVGE